MTGNEVAPNRKKLIYNPTINQQIRNRVNFKKAGGEITQQRWPPVKKFVPCNKYEARRDAQNTALFAEKDEMYDHYRRSKFNDH